MPITHIDTDDGFEEIQQHVAALLKLIEPETHSRHGLKDTPKRVAKMYGEIFAGYDKDGSILLAKTFEDDVIKEYGGIVLVGPIPFFSMCEHHMAVFHGEAWVGYLRRKHRWWEKLLGIKSSGVVGLSKLARLVEVYARRLQVQERMTEQITDDIQKYMNPDGVMVVVSAIHTCMCSRGAKSLGSVTKTSSVRGTFKRSEAARNEFLQLIGMK